MPRARADRVPTLRQREVLARVSLGLTTKEIAAQLGVSQPAVKKHVARLMRRYAVESRVGLVRYAIADGLVALPESGTTVGHDQADSSGRPVRRSLELPTTADAIKPAAAITT